MLPEQYSIIRQEQCWRWLAGVSENMRIYMKVILEIRNSAKIERIEVMIHELNKGIAHDFNDVVENVKVDFGILKLH